MSHHEERKKKVAEKHKLVEKRNFRLGVWNGILFNLGTSFISPTTVLPGFLSILTSSSGLIGFITTFQSIGWYLPQLPMSVWVQHKHRKLPVYRASSVIRAIAFTVLAVITLLSPSKDVLLVTAVVTLLTFYLASGPGGLIFMDLYAKAIPPDRRGKFIGLRMAVGGVLAATFGAAIISFLVSEFPFPFNFGLVFAIGALITSAGLFFMGVMREPREKVTTSKRTFLEQLNVCIHILRVDQRYRRYTIARLSFEIFTLGLPFIFLFASKHLGYSTSDLGIFIVVECVGLVISNYIWARIADRNSNKAVLVSTVFIAMLVPLMIIAYSLFNLPRILFPAIFMLAAAVDAGKSIGGMGYLVDIIPAHERMTYSALYNSLLAVPVIFATLAGVLLDSFGYVVLYTLLFAAMIMTYYLLRGLEDVHASERR